MIKTELYFDFRRIFKDDYTEQINFYEKNATVLEDKKNYENLLSRTMYYPDIG